MSRRVNILKAKITPPQSAAAVSRDRLAPHMDAVARKRLTTVSAGAGYGKTTFAVQAIRRLGLPTAWVGLDEKDRDLPAFLRYVTAAVDSCLSGFGRDLAPLLDRAPHPEEGPERLITPFLNVLEDQATVPLILVLDDYHAVQEDEAIQRAMALLLRHLPPTVHLVLTGRTEPHLSLSRLRASRALQEVREDDLAFTVDETEGLFRDLFHADLSPAQRDRLHDRTGGWVSGLVLFRHSTLNSPPEERDLILAGLEGTQRVIAAYLEENVLQALPEERRRFLLRTSILSRLDPSLCDRLLDRTDSGRSLRALVRDHLFTLSVDDGGDERFQVHGLFREFLLGRLPALFSESEVRALHGKAAALLEADGQDEEALEHRLLAGQTREACRILERIAVPLLLEGRYPLIRSTLEKIPESSVRNEPWFQFIQAGGLELSGRLREAAALYEKAIATYQRRESPAYRAICLQSLARALFLLGELEQAEARLLELLDQGVVTSFHPLGTLGYLVFIAAFHGRIEDADRWYRQGKALIAEGRGHAPEFEAWLAFGRSARFLASGDLQRAFDTAELAMEAFTSYRRSRGGSVYSILMATICHRMGRFTEGLAYAEEGLLVVREKPYQDSARGRLLLLSALNRAETDGLDEALLEARQGLICLQQNPNARSLILAHTVLHLLYRSAGDDTRAEAHASEGLDLAGSAKERVLEGELRMHLSGLHIERGETGKALPHLRAAEKALSHSAWDRCMTALLRARLHQDEGRVRAALKHLAEALRLAERCRCEPWIARQKDWILPLMAAALSGGVEESSMRRCLSAMGPTGRQELERLRKGEDPKQRKAAARLLQGLPVRERPGLKVCMLGRFRVWIGDEEVPRKRWRGSQPLALFKFLLHAYPRTVKSHALMELLWPGLDPATAGKRLNVALVSLRKALEPDRPPGRPPAYLLRSGDAYRIDTGDAGWVDAARFQEAVRKAGAESDSERSAACLQRAESLYGGDFLEEDPYAEWCETPREQFRRDYIHVLSRLVDIYDEAGDPDRSIVCAEKGLDADPYDEVLYQRLMRLYQRTGNRAMVVRTFERCRKRIEETLHCTLAEETQTLFEEILG